MIANCGGGIVGSSAAGAAAATARTLLLRRTAAATAAAAGSGQHGHRHRQLLLLRQATTGSSAAAAGTMLHHQPYCAKSVRTTIGGAAGAAVTSSDLSPSAVRTFASSSAPKPAKKKKGKKGAADDGDDSGKVGYMALKLAAKERRRELFEAREARKERLRMRRRDGNGKKKRRDDMRRDFRQFFIKKKVDEEYMDRKARQAGLGWKVQVAVVLERLNVVLPDKEDWEVEYDDLTAHLKQFGKIYPKGLYNVDHSADLAVTEEELMKLLPKGYVPAPRETEADASGDVRTINRKLKTSVYLTVLEDGQWMMPTVDLEDGETLLDAAKRAVPLKVGPAVEFWCPSNAPWSVDMVAFPEDERASTGCYGTKKFFMKIQHDDGDVSEADMTVQDFAWLDRGEVVDRIRNDQGDYVAKFYHYML